MRTGLALTNTDFEKGTVQNQECIGTLFSPPLFVIILVTSETPKAIKVKDSQIFNFLNSFQKYFFYKKDQNRLKYHSGSII